MPAVVTVVMAIPAAASGSSGRRQCGGGDNDGYADNLAFVLAAPNEVPEPVGLAFLALALVPVSMRLRRRR